jgi:hypothetical protein
VRTVDFDDDGDVDGADLAALADATSGIREILPVFAIYFGK